MQLVHIRQIPFVFCFRGPRVLRLYQLYQVVAGSAMYIDFTCSLDGAVSVDALGKQYGLVCDEIGGFPEQGLLWRKGADFDHFLQFPI